MKKILYAMLVLASIIAMSSCINDEEATDLELITPVDSTKTK